MQYNLLPGTDRTVSRIGLGTAEIGFEYGIGYRPLISEYDAIHLLKRAYEQGINYFDTANFYGLAEKRIGKSGITREKDVVIASKCGQFLEKGEDPRGPELEKKLREQVEESLRKLNMECVTILMLHGGTAEQIKRGEFSQILRKFKKEGKAEFIGISVRGEGAAMEAINNNFSVINVAYSILDQRMERIVFAAARNRFVGVVSRSVLLKGVLSPLADHLPKKLQLLKDNSAKAKKIAKEFSVKLPTLGINFALSCPYIDVTLVGTNNLRHLSDAIKAVDRGTLNLEVMANLKRLAINDIDQIDPSRWPQFAI